MEEFKKEDVKLGMWYSICCHKDLYKIKNESDMKEVQDMVGEYDTLEIWDTEKEALLDIRKTWGDSKEELAEIDERLAKL